MKCKFGRILEAGLAPVQKNGQPQTDAQMEFNEFGQIAYDEWIKLPERFSNFELDVFQIMPNHMHGIIVLNDNDGVIQNDDSIQGVGVNPTPTNTTTHATVGDIVGAYKSLVANACLKIHQLKWIEVNPTPYMGKLWQRNYYEHIIHTELAYQRIADYIINNPAKWYSDKFHIR